MSTATIVEVNSDRVALSGAIDVDNAMDLKAQGEALIRNSGASIEFDLSGVLHSGSVGVTVLLAWMRAASAADKQIVFLNMPGKMFDIARVSGLDDVLPLRTT